MQGTFPTPQVGHAGVTIGENWYIVGGGDNKSLMIVENGRGEYAKAIYGENVVMTYLSWNIINVSLFHASSPGIGYQIKQPENPSYKHAITAPDSFKWQRMVETLVWKVNVSHRCAFQLSDGLNSGFVINT